MTILNAPIRDSCVSRRERTNTPTQALLLLNEGEYLKAARNLAQLALSLETADDLERISFLYETVTSKLPDPSEQEVLSTLVDNLHERYQSQPALADALCNDLTSSSNKEKTQIAAWTVLVNTLYNLDITKTRE